MNKQPLTQEQTRAAEHGNGPLLIVAGAGTGKTRVITNRIAGLIEEKGIKPHDILAVTFTNNAAEEMRERLSSMISGSFDELWIGTFHSLGADILREHALDFGISPFFRIITPGEQLLLLAGELDSFGFKYHLVKGRPYGLLSELLKTIAKAKDELITVDEYRRWVLTARSGFLSNTDDLKEKERQKLDDMIGKSEELVSVFERYNELLLQNDYLDFADLIICCIQLFKEKPHILGDYQSRWKYVLVDEFQDTNLAQSRLIEMIAAGSRNLCVVGDDDQSIYRFRGAAISNILEFQKRHQDAVKVFLEENYRSTGEILNGAYAVVSKNTDRLDKRLRASAADPDSLRIIETESAAVEAQFVLNKIVELLKEDDHLSLSDFAVLARRKSDMEETVRAFAAAGLSFNLSGGSGYFDFVEIRDLFAWLRAIIDPFESDAVIRTLEAQPFSLDQIESSRINMWCRRQKIHLIDGLKNPGGAKLSPAALAVIGDWLAVFERLSKRRYQVTSDILLREVIDITGYRVPLLRRETLDNIQRLANIARLENLAREFVGESDNGGVRQFLEYIKLLQAGGEDASVDINPIEDSVNLMTIHKAKGLEFDTVFVVGATDNAFPGKRRSEAVIPDELLKESTPPNQATHEAESRRLFYVACTRAKQRLFISYPNAADVTGKTLKRSRFIDDIIDETAPPLTSVSAADVSKIGTGLTALARRAESELLAAAGNNVRAIDDDDAALNQLAGELADFFDVKKSGAAARGENKEVIDKIDALIDNLIAPEYRPVVKSPLFTAKLKEAEAEENNMGWLNQLRAVDYRDFLPLNDGGGLNLSVSDILDYQKCPYAFKVKYIYHIPPAPMVEAEFGTFFHAVLEAYHRKYGRENADLEGLTKLYDEGIKVRRLGRTTAERQLIERGRTVLPDYFSTFKGENGTPKLFEEKFEWHLGPHWIRGKVDRADELPGGGYELIDYKTGKAWTPKKVREDLQLAIYSLAAVQSWNIIPERLSYYFIMENKKMPAAFDKDELSAAEETIKTVAADILAQHFEPRADFMNCKFCDFRLLCPAHER